ncbi:hypothetical protein [Riemerella columbina]|uniref:hypothetical protein n=1 Tax=Riemerella columbina TaxID=103810 RepID=UPI0003778250|nr:hypothetical protein [Riemerella columbina]
MQSEIWKVSVEAHFGVRVPERSKVKFLKKITWEEKENTLDGAKIMKKRNARNVNGKNNLTKRSIKWKNW